MAPLMHRFHSFVAASAVAIALCVGTAHAGLIAQGTRVVFPASEREVTLRVSNTSGTPVLAQAWIDDGRQDVPPRNCRFLQCHAGRDASGPQWRRRIAHRLPEGPVADGSRIAVLAEYPGSSAQGRRRKQCIAVFLSFALQTLLSTQPVEECRFGCRETSMEVSGVRGAGKRP